MAYIEHNIQCDIIKAVRLAYGNRLVIFSCDNGRKTNVREAARWKKAGGLPGVSDLIVCFDGRTIFIEVKKPNGGRQSAAQKEFQKNIQIQGFDYHIVTSVKDVLDLLESQLSPVTQ